ncbi:3-isopropylmalate dehydratase small subunit [Ramlibacter rhizophilus]|uniref:3-isopropylmalate dehydratase n=1 Tax=Ramlibacter rhizophilus TaxID=1781167 RepID=A0A4Z0C297_9BURK|nr:3-isopropylmalate dehydratase small subunit [Ramlibacter rhizophilus]TFZ05072.1 3-isopropylmalate dehydratase small subunit [Ramlibacter rhizophilus]
MEPLTVLVGPAAPLMLANVDTDVIIRIERLTTPPAEGLGPYAFEALRYAADGSPAPDFVLNQPAFREAPILLAGPNFGCGSSREGAVHALRARGIRCVVAPSFGDIFFNNCFQNGLLPICLPLQDIQQLAAEAAGGGAFTVDLQECTLRTPAGQVLPFTVDPLRRQALLHGEDDIASTLKHLDQIRAWQAQDRLGRPWAWPPVPADAPHPST